MRDFAGKGLDLTQEMAPPKQNFVTCRVVKDVGDTTLVSGALPALRCGVSLSQGTSKGCQHTLAQSSSLFQLAQIAQARG